MDNMCTDELDAESLQQLDLAERELKAALIFAKFSSTSYSAGNLQRATDARSKAKAVCASAERRLAVRGADHVRPHSVKLIWKEVQSALEDLPALRFGSRVNRAGS